VYSVLRINAKLLKHVKKTALCCLLGKCMQLCMWNYLKVKKVKVAITVNGTPCHS